MTAAIVSQGARPVCQFPGTAPLDRRMLDEPGEMLDGPGEMLDALGRALSSAVLGATLHGDSDTTGPQLARAEALYAAVAATPPTGEAAWCGHGRTPVETAHLAMCAVRLATGRAGGRPLAPVEVSRACALIAHVHDAAQTAIRFDRRPGGAGERLPPPPPLGRPPPPLHEQNVAPAGAPWAPNPGQRRFRVHPLAILGPRRIERTTRVPRAVAARAPVVPGRGAPAGVLLGALSRALSVAVQGAARCGDTSTVAPALARAEACFAALRQAPCTGGDAETARLALCAVRRAAAGVREPWAGLDPVDVTNVCALVAHVHLASHAALCAA
jgi:hypothetical protein